MGFLVIAHHVLIVGCGSIGERHLRCFLQTGRTKVTACEANERLLLEIRKRYGVEGTNDWEGTLGGRDITAVVVATPAHLHIPMAQTALKAGKHVFIEKPLSTKLDGAEHLLAMRDEGGLTAVVGYVHRFIPAVQSIKSFLQTGEFGKPLLVSAVGGQHFPRFRPAYREIYFVDHRTGGGAIQDALTHIVNAIEWLVGPCTSVTCDASHQFLDGVTVEDTVNLIARSGPILISCSHNLFQAPNEQTLEVHAERGSVKAEYHKQRWGTMSQGEESWTYHDASYSGRDSLFVTQANAFLDRIEGKPAALTSLEDAIQTLRVNLAALESTRLGKTIEIATNPVRGLRNQPSL